MKENKRASYIEKVLKNMPNSWLNNTTHRLDIYDEKLAKIQFTQQFEILYNNDNYEQLALKNLPTAYDYIRLGHPLSCILEWALGKSNNIRPENVISFSSKTIPVLAILRKNLLNNKNTQISYIGETPKFLKGRTLKDVYGYKYELNKITTEDDLLDFDGTSIFISNLSKDTNIVLPNTIDFYLNCYTELGSILLVNKSCNEDYIPEIQHVRRRETIAMTPANCVIVLKSLLNETSIGSKTHTESKNKRLVTNSILEITGTKTTPIIGSSGLSIQYAIMMGLIHDALERHPGKDIKIIVPTNCYGGTNDQARRVASCIENVEVVDLDVDGKNDMTQSIDLILDEIAIQNAVPFIIAEIPTNPRVEVPDLIQLKTILEKKRETTSGELAINPVFVLDQTFCPNTPFLDGVEIFSKVSAISYVSGSKFPSGGLCTAGYCVGNEKTISLMYKIEKHLRICDNEATDLQYEILAKQLPSMNQRIIDAYQNTRDFVNFITKNLPSAKINFVSKDLAHQGFTPSVFSLDLPTKGNTNTEK